MKQGMALVSSAGEKFQRENPNADCNRFKWTITVEQLPERPASSVTIQEIEVVCVEDVDTDEDSVFSLCERMDRASMSRAREEDYSGERVLEELEEEGYEEF